MPTSLNGWPVLKPGDPKLVTRTIPGTTRKITMRAEVIPLFLAFAADYNRQIARIDVGAVDDWGYAYRQARAANAWSDHSSGTALDLNATHEGAQGPSNYSWWAALKRYVKVAALRRKYGSIIQWGGAAPLGGEYHQAKNYDWMHWFIKPGTSVAQVQAQIKKMGIRPDGTVAAPKPVTPAPKPAPKPRPVLNVSRVQPGMRNGQVLILQQMLKKEFPAFDYSSGPGVMGPKTQAYWKVWEHKIGIKAADSKPDIASLTVLCNRHGYNAAK